MTIIKRNVKSIVPVLFILAMVAVDQATKYWACEVLAEQSAIPLIPGVFQLRYIENRGAAFSILQGQRLFFAALTLVILCGIAWALLTERVATRMGKWALYLVSAGAIGNLIDRLARGYVVDMLDFCLIDFPVFNFADILVTGGAMLLAAYILFQTEKKTA